MVQVEFSPDELDGFAGTLDRQDEQLDAVARHADVTCRTVCELGDARRPLDDLGAARAELVGRFQSGLGEAAQSLRRAARDYRARDADAAARFGSHLTLDGGPVAEATGGAVRLLPPAWTQPAPDARLAEYEELWHRITGDSLVNQVTVPLLGRTERLSWLAGAYAELAAATAATAGDVGAGIPAWRTPAGIEFAARLGGWASALSQLAELDLAVAAGLRRTHAEVAGLAARVATLTDELVEHALLPLRGAVYPDRSRRIWLMPAQTKEIYAAIRGGLAYLEEISGLVAEIEECCGRLGSSARAWREALTLVLPVGGGS